MDPLQSRERAGSLAPPGVAESPDPCPDPGPAREYRMSMAVELWFGDDHIGVKDGSATCLEFLRYANGILADFHTAVNPRA